MARQLTTAISDLVLVLSVIFFVYHVFWVNFFAAFGLSIQGMAAGVGTYRFAMSRPDSGVTNYHKMLSWLAQVAGVPLIGVGFAHNTIPILVNLNFLFIIGAIIASRLLNDSKTRQLLTEAASGFGMLTVIIVCVRFFNLYGLLGAAAYVSSGLVIGSEGYFHGVPRIDILHYVLAAGNVFFKMALV